MASEDIRKKWGTIYMGNREASLEQLNAMQEPLRREQEKKEKTEDYMERVKARAADRAREILGAAYAERQKVLEEARQEIAAHKRQAAEECARLKAEGEAARKMGQAELAKAQETLADAEKIREAAQEEGFQHGMDNAGVELHEFRAELGQSLAAIMKALERERKNILENWRQELAELTQAAVQAGTGMLLQNEHETILRNLVYQALDLLENRSVITMRVNPADETQVSDMFRAARERVPELKQWIVTGDPSVEAGGLVAETASGSIDLQRCNFRELVEGVLSHLGLPDLGSDAENISMRDLVEKEVAHIAGLTPELEIPASEQAVPPEPVQTAPELEEPEEIPVMEEEVLQEESQVPEQTEEIPEAGQIEEPAPVIEPVAEDPTLAELEDELFPLDSEEIDQNGPQQASPPEPAPPAEPPDPKTLAEGGFL